MTKREAVAAREALGLTTNALAAELGLTPHVVEAWEAGSISVPKRFADQLRWQVAAAERQAALAASGLPECEWVAAWESGPIPESLSKRAKHFEALTAHAAQCPTCRARDAYISERFPAMPPAPVPHWVRGVGWITERTERLPRWARPAVTGAIVFAAYSIFKIVIMLPSIIGTPNGWLVALGGLFASASLGAALGLAYGGIRELWRRLRPAG